MLARLKSEIAYAGGILRALKRTRPIAENRSLTLGDYLERWAKTYDDRPALLSETETFTYRQLDARANRYARWARAQGLGKGDAICLMMANRPEYVAIWLGMARAGVATALVNTNLAGPSLAHSIAIVGAKAAIVDAHHIAQFGAALAKLDRKGVARLRDEQRDFNATRNKSFGRPDYQLKREMERRLVVLRGMAARN